jgi:hypothetical protein
MLLLLSVLAPLFPLDETTTAVSGLAGADLWCAEREGPWD